MDRCSQRVLVVEDEPDIARLLNWHLEKLGCTVVHCVDGRAGLARAMDGTRWSLLVLDLHLPGLDGLEICRQVRASARYAPILMLTARAAERDLVHGLEIGADDYLTKPFSVVEFAARVKAILRRVDQLGRHPQTVAHTLRILDLEIDSGRRVVRRGDAMLELTAREFDLLAYLAAHPGQVYTRAQLLDQVWGISQDAFEHTVNSHINRLRAKIETNVAQPRYIETVWGVGYRAGGAAPRPESA